MGIIDTAWEKRIRENNSDNFGIAEISAGLLDMAKMAYSVGWLDSDSARKADGAKTPTNNAMPKPCDSGCIYNNNCHGSHECLHCIRHYLQVDMYYSGKASA
jgi:hypothetical protein